MIDEETVALLKEKVSEQGDATLNHLASLGLHVYYDLALCVYLYHMQVTACMSNTLADAPTRLDMTRVIKEIGAFAVERAREAMREAGCYRESD